MSAWALRAPNDRRVYDERTLKRLAFIKHARQLGFAVDAIRTLLELAPPMAVVLRDGTEVEIPTAEVQVGDLVLARPGANMLLTDPAYACYPNFLRFTGLIPHYVPVAEEDGF